MQHGAACGGDSGKGGSRRGGAAVWLLQVLCLYELMGACITSTTDAAVIQEAELGRARLSEARRLKDEAQQREKATAGESRGQEVMALLSPDPSSPPPCIVSDNVVLRDCVAIRDGARGRLQSWAH